MSKLAKTNSNGEAIVQPPQWTQNQRTLIKEQIAPGASDLELEMFGQICARTRLDPFSKQIYAIQRKNKMTIQVSIDGYRAIADRTGKYVGSETFWCGTDGQWSDAWLSSEPPSAAKVVVYKAGSTVGFSGVARFDAYAQTTKNGDLTSMWKIMPDTMIAKCAEALALRKAFPQQLSGTYSEDEMAQADNPSAPVMCSPGQQNEIRNYPASGLVTKDRFFEITGDRKAHEIPADEFKAVVTALERAADNAVNASAQ